MVDRARIQACQIPKPVLAPLNYTLSLSIITIDDDGNNNDN